MDAHTAHIEELLSNFKLDVKQMIREKQSKTD